MLIKTRLLNEEVMMNIIDQTLKQQIDRAPCKVYQVLVRTDRSYRQLLDELARQGVTIHRTFRFINTIVMSASGEFLLALSQHPHIVYIELDEEVSI